MTSTIELCSLRVAQDRGLWKSSDSMRRYQKHGRLTAQLNKLSQEQRTAAGIAAYTIEKLLLDELRKF